jgi:hypothetical protein
MGIWLESKVNKFLQRLKRLEERRKLPAKLQGLVLDKNLHCFILRLIKRPHDT